MGDRVESQQSSKVRQAEVPRATKKFTVELDETSGLPVERQAVHNSEDMQLDAIGLGVHEGQIRCFVRQEYALAELSTLENRPRVRCDWCHVTEQPLSRPVQLRREPSFLRSGQRRQSRSSKELSPRTGLADLLEEVRSHRARPLAIASRIVLIEARALP